MARRPPPPPESLRVLSGATAILLGTFGVHRFVLGDIKGGLIRLLLGLIGIGGVLGIIEGIVYLSKSDDEFVRIYQIEKRQWF